MCIRDSRKGTGEDRCVLDCITSLKNGADLIWIETEKPHIEQIGSMVKRVRNVIPDAKVVYNNSPSFNWTLNFRQQVFDDWEKLEKDLAAYDRNRLMDEKYDDSELSIEADNRIRTFQRDASRDVARQTLLIRLLMLSSLSSWLTLSVLARLKGR